MPRKRNTRARGPVSTTARVVVARKKAPQAKGGRKATIARSPSHHLVSMVCGVTDPFCPHSSGAKYPDNSSARTLTYTRRGLMKLDTSGGSILGTQAWYWHPQFYNEPIAPASLISAAGVVTGWSPFPSVAPIAGVTAYRIVSSGFTLKNISNLMTTDGLISLRSWAKPDGAEFAIVDTTSFSASAAYDVPLLDCKDVATITQRSTRLPQAFVDTDDDRGVVTNTTDNGFLPVTILLSAASTNKVYMSWVINYELVFDDSSGLAQLATNPPLNNPLITQAAAAVTSSVGTIFSRSASAIGDVIVRKAAQAVAGLLGGPPAAAAAGGAIMAYQHARSVD